MRSVEALAPSGGHLLPSLEVTPAMRRHFRSRSRATALIDSPSITWLHITKRSRSSGAQSIYQLSLSSHFLLPTLMGECRTRPIMLRSTRVPG